MAQQYASPPSAYQPSEYEIQTALSKNLITGLPSATLALAGLYLALTLAHVAMLPPEPRVVLAPIAGMSALFFFVVYFCLRAEMVPHTAAHTVAGLSGVVALINSLLHVGITGDALQSSNVMLVIVAIGAFFLSTPWFWALVVAAFSGWIAIALSNEMTDSWVHFAIGMVMSILAAAIVNRARMTTFAYLFRLRLRQAQYSEELETAQAQLELRVQARTAELAETNRTLQDEVRRRRDTENALKLSERSLMQQRTTLQRQVEQQTEELRKANQSLKETTRMKTEAIDEIRHEIQPMVMDIRSKMRLLEIGMNGSADKRRKVMMTDMMKMTDELLESLNSMRQVATMSSKQLKQHRFTGLIQPTNGKHPRLN